MIIPTVFDIKFSEKNFDRSFKAAVQREINNALVNAQSDVLEYIKKAVRRTLESSPEYYSLIEGDLAFQFGFVKGSEKSYVDPVIDYIVNSITIDVNKFVYDIGGGYSINLCVLNIDELSQIGKASYISKPSNEPVEWLNWLLTQGNKIIIQGYFINIGKFAPKNSRSTKALMVKSSGRSWGLNTQSKVPSELAGTIDNNWVTRAIDLYMGDNAQGIIPFNVMEILGRYLS